MKITTQQYGEVHVLVDCPLVQSTERLEWLTEVHQSFGGSEIRYPLRDVPRQILNFSYTQVQKGVGDIFNMLYANLRKQWAIPLPQIQLQIPDLAAADFIIVDTTATIDELRVGFALVASNSGLSAVEIIAIGRYIVVQEEIRDPDTDEIIQEQIVEYQDGFRLAEPITATNAIIMPMRICIIDGDAAINTGGFWSNATVTFRVLAEDLSEYSSTEPEQYNGNDIYYKPLVMDGDSLEMTLMQQQTIVDGDVGGFQSYTHHLKPKYLKPFKIVMRSWQEYREYKKFLARRSGRNRAFYMPLYEQHLNILNTGMVGTVLNTDTKYIVEASRKHIAVKRKNGVWSAHTITNRTAATLTVTPSIATNMAEIDKIYYLGLHRLDADQIEFQFLGSETTQATVPILEIDN